MRKIFLLTGIFFALAISSASYGATTQAITLIVNGTDAIAEPSVVTEYKAAVYSGDTISEDEIIGELLFPALSGTNYEFSTVPNALDFANNPQVYIQENYEGTYKSAIDARHYTVTYDPSLRSTMNDVTISIRIASLNETVDLTNYGMTSITFTATQTITVPEGNRHFIAGGTSTVTFNGIIFSGSNNTAGGISISNGTVSITGCTFNNCDSSSNGGAVSITGGTVTLSKATFTGNTAGDNGGAISLTGGTLTVSDTTFTGNDAGNNGGAISQTNGTTTITGSSTAFDGNTAYSGGAISVTGGSLTVSEATFIGNGATRGGAIYSSSGLTIGAGVTFNTLSLSSPNTAQYGGAIYVNGGTTTISGSNVNFTENRADYGGAIYAASGTVNVSGAGISFTENVVSNDGGAIWTGAGSRVNLTGDSLTVTGNEANDGSGGAIYASGDRSALTISSTTSTFASNYASANGGAILSGGGNSLTISGTASFTTNNATNGGAIYLSATRRAHTTLSITGESEATFAQNTATTSGGGIYAQAYSVITIEPTATFTGNSAEDGNGGAMYLAESSQLPEGTINFSDNTATKSDSTSTTTGSGGAVYIAGSSSTPVTIGTTRKYDFSGNRASSYGGAICTYSSDITFSGYTQSETNSATLGGGFCASYNATITLNNSSLNNQTTQGRGGAIWAMNIVTVSSDFSGNTSTGTGNHIGGGALYSLGELTLTQSVFTGNSASQGGGAAYSYNGELTVTDATFTQNTAVQGGGALYAEASTVSVTNSYFATNTTSSGNGGAVALQGYCRSTLTSSTFRNNTSSKLDGGAIYAQGTLSITLCFLRENKSQRSGGAIYFNQNSDNPSNYSSFTMTSTMLEENSTSGVEGNGGGLYVVANDATITACTFNGNRLVLAGNSGEGGGAYISASPIQNEDIEITNCTFYDNHIDDESESGSGGGGLAIHCEKTTVVKSCTFAVNGSKKGGGIYLGDGSKLQISGTMLVGNTDEGTYDLWSDGNISSGGFNRIGVYGTGTGVTDFYSETRNDTDRTPSTGTTWTRYTFFSNNTLAVNARTDLGSNIPPYLGSTLASRTRLLTLMLSEDATLPTADRATNIIPYTRRGQFPTTDERGVPRVPSGSTIALDIGACFFDGTRYTDSENPVEAYTISRIEISGIPNNLRRVGQTASLVAKVYYTNGRTALGGTATGEEPITWASDKPSIIRINPTTGDIVVLSFTPGNTYVTITASTVRGNASGVPVTDSKPIRVTEYTYSYLNTTDELIDYLTGYRDQLTEYDISIQLADKNSSAVKTSTFQSSFAQIWSGVTASQVTNVNTDNMSVNTLRSYTANDGYTLASGKAGVNVIVSGVSAGALIPLTYSWSFSAKELNAILGYDMAEQTITSSLADKIFSAMRIDFAGDGYSHPVIGNGGVSASQAMTSGALSLTKTDGDAGLHADLTAYLANVTASSATVASLSSTNDGPQIVNGLLIVPDGNGNDSKISGTMWMANKLGASTVTDDGQKSGTKSSGGGGGGCNALGVILLIPLAFILKKR